MNQQDFGLRLKELRQGHALTQSQLAGKIEISRQAYVNYESGRTFPPAEVIARLSQVFGIDLMKHLYNHTTLTYGKGNGIMTGSDRNDFFTLFELYSKLSPLAKKRIITLVQVMVKGGEKQ